MPYLRQASLGPNMRIVVKARCICGAESFTSVTGPQGIILQGRTCSTCDRIQDDLNVEVRSDGISEGIYAQAPRRKTGRPLDKDRGLTLTAMQPWRSAGISRRTWYRRRKAEQK